MVPSVGGHVGTAGARLRLLQRQGWGGGVQRLQTRPLSLSPLPAA